MTRYYFDIHDEQGVWPDEEGCELPDMQSAQKEAALSLAGMARSEISGKQRHHISVKVHTTESGAIFESVFIFEVKLLQ